MIRKQSRRVPRAGGGQRGKTLIAAIAVLLAVIGITIGANANAAVNDINDPQYYLDHPNTKAESDARSS